MEIRPFKANDLVTITEGKVPFGWPEVRERAGPAITAISGDKIIACGGVSIYGVGEVWSAYTDEARKSKFWTFKNTKEFLEKTIKENYLWRLVAVRRKNIEGAHNFLRHLGFEQTDTGLYVKV